MKTFLHFLKRNRYRIFFWFAALFATVPFGLFVGSNIWHGLDDYFNPIGLHEQVWVLCMGAFSSYLTVFILQVLARKIIKKFVPVV